MSAAAPTLHCTDFASSPVKSYSSLEVKSAVQASWEGECFVPAAGMS